MADPTRADPLLLELLPPRNARDGAPCLSPLPVPRTSFVGRRREIDAGVHHVRESRGRLLTLTGPGGVGKSRLAIRIAEEAAHFFPDGVAFVPLAAIHDPALVAPAIAAALGVREAAGPLGAALAILDRRMLLVIDNFEQILGAGPTLAGLLEACPRVVAVVTSRAPLHISGEQVFPVPPLALPVAGSDQQAILAAEAVQLFTERARAVDPAFALTGENALAVAAVCQRLDGLPLAVELAAAKTRLLSPGALLPRLAHRLPLLGDGPREAPGRLRTMRHAIAWSHDLLSPAEQTVFRRLAVFAGGFTLGAAEIVAGEPGLDVFSCVESLVEQSLLQRLTTDEPRLGMLETVHEFALENLTESGELDTLRDRHAAWVMTWGKAIAPDPVKELGPEQGAWLRHVARELSNLRAALARLIETDDGAAALQLIVWTDLHWTSRVLDRAEVRRWIETGLATAPAISGELRAGALHVLICATASLGEPRVAVRHAESAVQNGRATADPFLLGRAQYSLGLAHEAGGEAPAAEAAYAAAVSHFRRIDAPAWLAAALGGLGDMRHAGGDASGAVAALDEAVSIYRRDGQEWGLTISLGQRAHVALTQRDIPLAARLFLESLAFERAVGNQCFVLGSVAGLAGVAWLWGQPERAARLLGARQAAEEQSGVTCVNYALHIERIVAAVRASLGDDAYAAACLAGRGMSVAEARAEAEEIGELASIVTSRVRRGDPFALTPREREILRLLAQGRSDREIADTLCLSRRTAQTHAAHIFAKLGVDNRTEAAAVAFREQLV